MPVRAFGFLYNPVTGQIAKVKAVVMPVRAFGFLYREDIRVELAYARCNAR